MSFSVVVLAKADESRRLFDFTPISASNPVVATIDTTKIPLSELRAYRDAERNHAITDPADLSQKRAVLESLINEYLYVDDAYRTGVAGSAGFVKQMDATRTMILTDFASSRATSEKEKAKTPVKTQPGEAGAALADRLFEAASIEISNEAYDLLKRAAKAVDASSAASKRGPLVDSKQEATAKLHTIVDDTPEAVLARYENKSISVHQVLVIYAGMPEPRPHLEMPEGLLAMIKPLILPELMAIEAVKQGIAEDPEFQNKIIQNRNALLRFHVQGLIEHKSSEMMQSPDIESQLRAWYDEHKTEYAATNEKGEKRIPTYAEARPRIEGDYSVALYERLLAEKAQALRKTRSVTIDEAVLKNL